LDNWRLSLEEMWGLGIGGRVEHGGGLERKIGRASEQDVLVRVSVRVGGWRD